MVVPAACKHLSVP